MGHGKSHEWLILLHMKLQMYKEQYRRFITKVIWSDICLLWGRLC